MYYCEVDGLKTDNKKKYDKRCKTYMKNVIKIRFTSMQKVFSSNRFDLMAKYIYVKYREKGLNTDFHKNLYLCHIESMNGYYEYPGTKKGQQDFLDCFDQLIDDMKNNGYDKTKFIPIDKNNILINGAHRTCVSFYLKIDPYILVNSNRNGIKYGYKYFLEKNKYPPLDIFYADRMALEYVKMKQSVRCMVLHPISYKINKNHNNDLYDEVRKIISEYGSIYYEKQITLTEIGLNNLMNELYRGENWVGGLFPRNGQSYRNERWVKGMPLTLIIIDMDNATLAKNKEMKEKCREIFNIEKNSLHTTDHPTDTFRTASSLLNSNSIDFLNHSKGNISKNSQQLLTKYFDNATHGHCLTSSIVMELYGFRHANNDIDYLIDSSIKKETFIHENISPHINMSLNYYPYHHDDIIYNPKHYFYFNGNKVATIKIICDMKKKRKLKKDLDDLKLIIGKNKYTKGTKKKYKCYACNIECNKLKYMNAHIAKYH